MPHDRQRRARPHDTFLRTLLATLMLLQLELPLHARPAAAHPGRWTEARNFGLTAVHMSLLRGDGSPFQARILWVRTEDQTGVQGKQFGWRALSASDASANFVDSSMIVLSFPESGGELFCSGQTQLQDGSLLVVGGTETGTENGMKYSYVFRPGAGTAGGAWTHTPDSLNERRWYGNAVLLPSGKALVTAGTQYPHLEVFGGLQSTAPVLQDSSLFRFDLVADGAWDSPATRNASQAYWPGPRYGHTVVPVNDAVGLYYGGHAEATDSLIGEVVSCPRNINQGATDYEYGWQQRIPVTTSNPKPRYEHSAIIREGDSVLTIYGGIKKDNGVLVPNNEAWRWSVP